MQIFNLWVAIDVNESLYVYFQPASAEHSCARHSHLITLSEHKLEGEIVPS